MMNSGMLELIRNWKSKGKIRTDLEDGMILALFNSIPYIDIHKEEIGASHFSAASGLYSGIHYERLDGYTALTGPQASCLGLE
ncbi:hypothetical protein ACFTAO_11005 [Paenibacillus rhizoplanae]